MNMALQGNFQFVDMEHLADEIGSMLQCPITIEDTDHRLLGYSSHAANVDAVRIATIVGRKVPEHVIAKLKADGVLEVLHATGEATFIEAEEARELTNRVAISVKHGKRTLGYIWAMVGEKAIIPPSWYEKLKYAATLVSAELLRQEAVKRQRRSVSEEFLLRLVSGQYISNVAVKIAATSQMIKLPSDGLLAVLEFDKPPADHLIRKELKHVLDDGKDVLSTIYNGKIILLIDRTDELSMDSNLIVLNDTLLERIQALGYPTDAAIGSSMITQYDRTPEAFDRAISVISIRQSYPDASKQVCLYENLGYLHYLPKVTEFVRTTGYIHIGIERLRLYDEEHDSELLETLNVLLEYDCQTKEVSKKLHIHPNTLSYRVQRIQEISGINLKSMSDKVTCFMFLKSENG